MQVFSNFFDTAKKAKAILESVEKAWSDLQALIVHHNANLFGSAANNATITLATNTSPIIITTAAAHGFQNGERVKVAGVLGNTAANGTWTIANVIALTMELVDSTGNGAFTSSPTARATAGYVELEPNSGGAIGGLAFTPADYLAAVTLCQQLDKLFTNQVVTTGDYKVTIARISSP